MASKRRVRRQTCGDKKSYDDQAKAAFVAYIMNQQQPDKVQAYRCKFCHQFHVGHANYRREE